MIKAIKGLATDIEVGEGKEPTIDIKIEEETLPVIRINFDAMKDALTGTLEKYKGIVVTKETLSGCKATQKVSRVKNED